MYRRGTGLHLPSRHDVSWVTMHSDGSSPELIAKVFDRRNIGSMIRGDPLIGEAHIQLGYLEFRGRLVAGDRAGGRAASRQ